MTKTPLLSQQLRGLCHVHADLDWNAISEKMEGRTAMQCCSQYLLKINTDFKSVAFEKLPSYLFLSL